jgi:hypothetical protein
VADRERAAWGRHDHRDDPDGDVRIAALWAAWFHADPWSGRDAWEALLLPEAQRAFRGVCEARRLPAEVRQRALSDLREGFFWALLGAGGDSPPAWIELALRTLETHGDGPVAALAARLDPEGWGRAARCVSHRGSWAGTIASWQPAHEPAARARAVAREASDNPVLPDALLDLHVVLRAIQHLDGDPHAALWGVVRQNRGRARGRLRALLAREPQALLEPLLALPQLLERTRAATRRFAWSWAWRELATDFAFDAARASTAPCLLPDAPPPPLTAEQHDALATWGLLVALRGRYDHLQRWVRTGSTGDRDSTWARLLAEACPDCLADPDASGRTRTYHRLRTELAELLPSLTRRWATQLAQIAALPSGRGLRKAFEALVSDAWSPEVPMPRSGFPTFQRHAAQLDARFASLAGDPASIGDDPADASTGVLEAP